MVDYYEVYRDYQEIYRELDYFNKQIKKMINLLDDQYICSKYKSVEVVENVDIVKMKNAVVKTHDFKSINIFVSILKKLSSNINIIQDTLKRNQPKGYIKQLNSLIRGLGYLYDLLDEYKEKIDFFKFDEKEKKKLKDRYQTPDTEMRISFYEPEEGFIKQNDLNVVNQFHNKTVSLINFINDNPEDFNVKNINNIKRKAFNKMVEKKKKIFEEKIAEKMKQIDF